MSGSLTGADISGLRSLVATLERIEPDVAGAVMALDRCVASLVNDTGWRGSAAAAFKNRWDQDALAGTGLAAAIKEVAGIAGTLADELSAAEKILEAAVATARANGIPVGPDGQPFVGPLPVAKAAGAAGYAQVYDETMTLVNQARRHAITRLQQVLAQIGPGDEGANSAQKAAIGDALRTLYTLPPAASIRLRDQLAEIRSQRAALKAEWRHLPKDTLADVRAAKWDERRGLWASQQEADAKLAGAEAAANDLPLTRALATPVSRVVPALAEETRLGRLLGDIPVLGAGAAVATTGFEMYDDMTTRHWSFWEALGRDAVPNAAGLGAETVVAATLPIDSTAAVAGLAVVAGYGIGSYGYELAHVPWSATIHHDGVVGGTIESFKQAGVATWQNDMYGLSKSVSHDATRLWRSIF
jgi:uncharacterized protein YukE